MVPSRATIAIVELRQQTKCYVYSLRGPIRPSPMGSGPKHPPEARFDVWHVLSAT